MLRYTYTFIIRCRIIYCLMVLLSCCVLTRAQNKRALVIGISNYQRATENDWSKIHGTNDVSLISPVLKKQGFKITKLCNEVATAKKIRKEFENLVKSSKTGDIVYIHFSGHGQPVEDYDGDEEDGWDEAIIPYDTKKTFQKGIYEGANHITDDEIYSFLQRLRRTVGSKGFIYLVVDACHAGEASRGEEENEEDGDTIYIRGTKKGFSPNGKEFRPRINATGHFVIPRETGLSDILAMEACRSYQSNCEIKQSGYYYGPLSYYIYKVLSNQKISGDIDWVLKVRNLMNSDRRVARQNMVYETSLK